jgi:hypothetical protein
MFTDQEADDIMAKADKVLAGYKSAFDAAKHNYRDGFLDDAAFLAVRKAYFDALSRWDQLFRQFDNNG